MKTGAGGIFAPGNGGRSVGTAGSDGGSGGPGGFGSGIAATKTGAGGIFAPGKGGVSVGTAGSDGAPGTAGTGTAGTKTGSGNLHLLDIQLQGTGEPPPDGVAVPVRIHTSMSVAKFEAAMLRVATGADSVAKPTGSGGGVATKAGAMPAATVVANAVKAASIGGIAVTGSTNADIRDVHSVACAALTVVDGGTIPEAAAPIASAQAAAHSAPVVGGLSNRSVKSGGESAMAYEGVGMGGPSGPNGLGVMCIRSDTPSAVITSPVGSIVAPLTSSVPTTLALPLRM